jgi:hypothetical protein
MNENTLTENEEKVLALLIFTEGSVTKKGTKEVFDWNDEVLTNVMNSLVSKEMLHNLTDDLQFGRNGRIEALKILTKRLFPAPYKYPGLRTPPHITR